jgi:hypothetical protein
MKKVLKVAAALMGTLVAAIVAIAFLIGINFVDEMDRQMEEME